MKFEVLEVKPEIAVDIYPSLSKLIDSAIKVTAGEYTLDSVLDGIVNGRYFLYVVIENYGNGSKLTGCVILNKEEYADGTDLNIFLLAGRNMKKWSANMMETIESIARDMDARRIRAQGRLRWEKHGRELGFTRTTSNYIRFMRGRPDWFTGDTQEVI